jgi:hypothetical protein
MILEGGPGLLVRGNQSSLGETDWPGKGGGQPFQALVFLDLLCIIGDGPSCLAGGPKSRIKTVGGYALLHPGCGKVKRSWLVETRSLSKDDIP